MDLDRYKGYQSQTPNDVLARRLSPKGGGHKAVCQQGHWAPKGGGLGSLTSRRLNPEVGWTRGNVPVRTPDPEGGGLGVPH